MRSLLFLSRKVWKNRLKQIVKSPGKLILYILILLGIVGLLLSTLIGGNEMPEDNGFADLVWLRGIMFGVLLISFLTNIHQGLKQGSALFQMNDVNFMFVSPIRPQSILLYAVIRTAGMAFVGGLFIFFQTHTLSRVFGFEFSGLIIIFFGYVLATILMQIMAMAIFNFANGNEARKRIVKIFFLALFAPLIVTAVLSFISAGGVPLPALESIVHHPAMTWMPVLGWVSEGTIAFLAGDIITGILFYGALLILGGLLLLYVYTKDTEYYEDALAVTEVAYEKIRAAAEGQINQTLVTDRKIKVAKTGLGGFGAQTFFFKHLRESSRQNRAGILSGYSFFLVAGAAAFALLNPGGGILVILGIIMGISIFSFGLGRGMKELYSHYIYLMPASPFSKMIWSNFELLFKTLIEATLAYVISGIILNERPFIIVSAIFIHVFFYLVLLGSEYLLLRMTGSHLNPLIKLTIFIAFVALILAPGLIAAVILSNIFGLFIGLIVFALWELIVALICFALAKGVLHNCDMLILDTRLTK